MAATRAESVTGYGEPRYPPLPLLTEQVEGGVTGAGCSVEDDDIANQHLHKYIYIYTYNTYTYTCIHDTYMYTYTYATHT